MTICPDCGAENRAEARFCDSCGAKLAAAPAGREERKVVSVLFTDLVGFTSRAERLDPEDVRATLSPYYARLRSEIERHGGTVEKFIGDAVMAVFGAPVAHEDDPERAVRAALAIRDAIHELNESESSFELQLRSAVTTGEALIALGARPSEGEGMASGDVVNTASRLQAAAPVNGILVGEATYRATSNAIEYRAAEPVDAKGKAEPIPVWEAVSARSRFGVDVDLRPRSELIGRERELALLVDALARCRSELSPQLITLVGVPGIGKSRLVAELFQVVDRDPDLIVWRQGRSLPYGEGLSYWALGEIAKAQAGILETDDEAAAEAKLRAMVEDVVADPAENDWVEGHFRPLVGLETTHESAGDRRSEAFSAWRRLVEALAEHGPVVLVFEDLHWSDDGLLDFVDYLADWASGVPLLVVCTARPELLDRRPGWGGGKRNAATISISPLSEGETGQLLRTLLDQTLLPAEIQSSVLARAEGNPLYAEEYVRMLQDRGFLVHGSGGWRLSHAEELPLPETVQGMIAARLDALAPAEKELVQDAAVLGKVFWPGALLTIGERKPREVEDVLHTLERKEFIRRERRSAVAQETQYAFLHLLVRDVAYGQIPRASRVDKHRLAAQWIESLSKDRSEDRAEMLAHHYREALSLASSAGVDVAALRNPAAVAFADAAERAWALNSWPAVVDFATNAVELTDDQARRAELHLLIARAQFVLGQYDVPHTVAARDGFQAVGELDREAEAETLLSELHWMRADGERAHEHRQRAVALIEGVPASRSKAFVLAQAARYAVIGGSPEYGMALAQQALPIAEELGLDALTGHVLNTIGMQRVSTGDEGGMADLERSAALAEATKSVDDLHRAYNNLANMAWQLGRLDAAEEYLARARQGNERYGNVNGLRWLDGEDMLAHEIRGNWDEALALADTFVQVSETKPHYHIGPAQLVRARVLVGRADVAGALAESQHALERARSIKDPQFLGPALLSRARALAAAGDRPAVDELIDEILSDHDVSQGWFLDLPLLLVELGREDEYLRATENDASPWVAAGRAAASGDLRAAAATYAEIGARELEARARLLAAETLSASGLGAEANAQLAPALVYFRRVGATAYIARGEALLAASA